MEQMDIFEQLLPPLPKIEKLKIGTFFSGIGAPEKALQRLGIDYELMFFSEIDKYAIQSYCAIHNEDVSKNKGDIAKIQGKNLPYCDMWFGGFPCQDISLAGKQKGFSKGLDSRSSLGWEMIRLLDEVKEKPKYVIFENVANIMSESMRPTLNLFKQDLEARGYTLWNEMLNAKDYGIPQNRERYFLIAILGKYYYKFPQKQELKLRLKDMLENEVDEKYYLSENAIKGMLETNYQQNKFETRVQDDVCSTLCARDWKDPKCVQVGELDIKGNDSIKRVYSDKGLSPTLTDMQGGNRQPKVLIPLGRTDNFKLENNLRIRKLTPKECYRLMGFDDEDYEKAAKVCSNSQLYKQAGNSIVVNVLMAIFKELLNK